MSAPVRWYNRLAAWLWERANELLTGLAMPVWIEQAEADGEEEYEAWVAEMDSAYDAGYEAAVDDGVDERESPW